MNAVEIVEMVNLAWATGLYEGEGSITAAPRPARLDGTQARVPYIALEMTTEEPVRRFAAIIGGKVNTRTRPDGSVFWRCVISNWHPTVSAMQLMWPWLSLRRREQAVAAFERCDQSIRGPRQRAEWRNVLVA